MPDYLEYRKSISRELMSIKNRVRNFIDDSHWGEDGRYKEVILSEILQSILPPNVSIGTDFIIGENSIKSTQIDIIIYKNNHPILFKKGDFVIISKEAVIGIIEVKSKLESKELKKVLEKAHKNGEIIGNDKFNGVFAYDTDMGFKRNVLHPNTLDKFKKYSGYINNIAFGEKFFMKYWKAGLPEQSCTENHISIYKIEELSIGYFISNLIEDAMIHTGTTEISNEYNEFLYPIADGKETYRKFDIKLSQN